MYVPFEKLPAHARIWIYQSPEKITKESQLIISDRLHAFTDMWKAHGHPLRASYAILHHHFVVVAVDESLNDASGCSIDACTHLVQEIQVATGLNLFDRTLVFFKTEDTITTVRVSELSKALQRGVWGAHTEVFDVTAKDLGELATWVKPASQTWLKRYLAKVAV